MSGDLLRSSCGAASELLKDIGNQKLVEGKKQCLSADGINENNI